MAFSVNDVVIRSFSTSLPLHEVVLFRALIGILFTLLVLSPGLDWRGAFRTRHPGLHAIRGACVVASNLTYFAALATLPLAETAGIYFVAPLLITAMSTLLLGERSAAWRWVALSIGLVGVLLIVKPGTLAFRWVMVLPLLSALAYAGMHMMTRTMGLRESATTMAIYTQLSFVVVCSMMGLVFGRGQFGDTGNASFDFLLRAWALPGWRDLMMFTVAGACSATGGFLVAHAYRSSSAGLVAPFEYTALVLAALWGFLFWGEVPGAVSAMGIALILATGVYAAWRESRR